MIVCKGIIHVNAPATLLEVNTNANVNISANVETVLVTEDASGARLEIANTARVGTLQANASIDIAGKGKLALLEANASGIKTAIKADNVNTASNVSKPTETTTGGGSSGGGGSSSSGGASTSFTAIVYESSLEFEDDTIINNTISKNAGELRILCKLNPEDSFVSVNPDYDTQIQLQTFEWSTTTPELITLRKSTSSCYITPTGTAGTAKLIYDSRTNLGGGRHIVIEMDIIITD